MIALITPTGARPKQINLCAKFMHQQDYKGGVLWVIVDDGDPITTDGIKEDFKTGWKIVKVFPKEKWRVGKNTQSHNILTGLEVVKQYKVRLVFMIEDDDYYTPRYLREMESKIGNHDVIGEQYSIYYNPVRGGWYSNENKHHSSLFQTAFKPSIIPIFEEICRRRMVFLDIALYRHSPVKRERIKFFVGEHLAIGIKGLNGRPGIGMGHRRMIKLHDDPKMKRLKELIGNDYIYYLNFKE